MAKYGGNDWDNLKTDYERMIESLLDDQSKLIDKIADLSKQGKSVENEVAKLLQQKNAIEAQRKETKERLMFSEIVLKCMRGKYASGNCDEVYDRIKKDLDMLEGNFLVIVYYGKVGGDHWGYQCRGDADPYFYAHEWAKDYCHVICKINHKRTSAFNNDTFCSLADKYYYECSGSDCIKTAGHIFDSLRKNYMTPAFVIVKQSPGGYDHWCYGLSKGNLSGYYHKWHDHKNFLGITYGSWCAGAQC
jgi:hypothetical protein